MTQYGYALLGLTAVVGILAALLTLAVLRFAAVRRPRHRLPQGGSETDLLSAALQDAVVRLKEQERAMSARADASERLSGQIVASLTAGVLVVDDAGRVVILNPAGRRMLRIPEDPVGADYAQLLSGIASLRDAIAECLATGRPIMRRSLQIVAAARMFHIGVTVSPLVGMEGGGAICLFSDLTNVVELEEQLRLKETLAQLGELTAGIAHEFRNGLATIHGYGRLIAPEALPSPYRTYMEGIRQEAEALGQVVTNFLNFARPEKISLSRVPLGQLATRSADELLRELPTGTTVETIGEFGEIEGDEVLLRQVFGNLVRNAAEACDGAGVRPAIVIEGQIDRARRLCRVSVADNGPGIPEGSRARVFQPFFTTRSRGTGLGLAIVQKIVVNHNGRVAVGVSSNGGAQVDLTFPMANGSTPPAPSHVSPE
jgi:nitrogen fixation/metabolism regulation signal transduction histidine kinase